MVTIECILLIVNKLDHSTNSVGNQQSASSMNAELNSRFVRDLGVQISCIRKKNGLTQAQLAELMAVEPETVSRFERGTATPSLQRIISIADVLGVSVQHLLGQASPLKSDKIALLEHLLGQIPATDCDLVMDMAIGFAKRFAEVKSL